VKHAPEMNLPTRMHTTSGRTVSTVNPGTGGFLIARLASPRFAVLLAGVQLLISQLVAVAAETAADDRPRNTYIFVVEFAGKEGAAERFSFVSSGGRLDVTFVSGYADVNGGLIPMISTLKTEFEAVQEGKLWLGQLSLNYTVPYVTGMVDYGGLAPQPGIPRAALPRAPRSVEEGGANPDAKPVEPSNQPMPSRMVTRGIVQQANAGISTSLFLTVGKTVTLFEDSKQRIRLTVDKLGE
jgi:hypothetical protein